MSTSIVENKTIYLPTKCKQYGRSTRKLLAEVLTVARRRLAKQCHRNDFACWRLQAACLRNTSLVSVAPCDFDHALLVHSGTVVGYSTQAWKQTTGDPGGQTWNYRGITLLYNFTTALLYMVLSVTMARIVVRLLNIYQTVKIKNKINT